jgi:antitoxin CptB
VDEKRLVWASRRGMLELDLILMPFLENIYPALSQSDKELYWSLLAEEDQDIYAWCMRRDDPDSQSLQRIVGIIRENTGLQIDK